MAAVYPRDGDDDPRTWPSARRLDAVAFDLVGGNAAPPQGVEQAAALLMNKLAMYQQFALAAYIQARPLFERALALAEKVLGPEHPATTAVLNNLALMLQEQGDLDAAAPLGERAVANAEKIL